ncbi:hypothetical protein CK203_074598 [Vitis vinifera]|uniref:Uncharacterized protein n=1 Tax=Vitis vinifera TaxID=29760 RepID=A0A438DWK5_VITVI|nr:hypothetical protein CK203_074598 [Vitis vinifera]
MAQNHSLSLLVAAMDGLWFNQVILSRTPCHYSAPLPSELHHKLPHQILFCIAYPTFLHHLLQKKKPQLTYPQALSTVDEEDDPRIKILGCSDKFTQNHELQELEELELEEVKGFMDLGFKFKREHLSPRMITVIPGLQRLGGYNNEQETELSDSTQSANYKDDKIEEKKRRREL